MAEPAHDHKWTSLEELLTTPLAYDILPVAKPGETKRKVIPRVSINVVMRERLQDIFDFLIEKTHIGTNVHVMNQLKALLAQKLEQIVTKTNFNSADTEGLKKLDVKFFKEANDLIDSARDIFLNEAKIPQLLLTFDVFPIKRYSSEMGISDTENFYYNFGQLQRNILGLLNCHKLIYPASAKDQLQIMRQTLENGWKETLLLKTSEERKIWINSYAKTTRRFLDEMEYLSCGPKKTLSSIFESKAIKDVRKIIEQMRAAWIELEKSHQKLLSKSKWETPKIPPSKEMQPWANYEASTSDIRASISKPKSAAELYRKTLSDLFRKQFFDSSVLNNARTNFRNSILLHLQESLGFSVNLTFTKRLDGKLNEVANSIVDSFEEKYGTEQSLEQEPDDFLDEAYREKYTELQQFLDYEKDSIHELLKKGHIPEVATAFGFVPEYTSELPEKNDFLSNAENLQNKIIAALKFLNYIEQNPQLLPKRLAKKITEDKELLKLIDIMEKGWIKDYSDLKENKNEWMRKYAEATSTFINRLTPIFLISSFRILPFRFSTRSVAEEKVETAIKQMQVMFANLKNATFKPTPSLSDSASSRSSKSDASSKSGASSQVPSTGPESPYLPETWRRHRH